MVIQNHSQELPSFDELVELAQHNPDAFTLLKREICEEEILSAPMNIQQELWAQQQHIDRVLNNCHSRKEDFLTNDDFSMESELIDNMNDVLNFQSSNYGKEKSDDQPSAEIIPFPSFAVAGRK